MKHAYALFSRKSLRTIVIVLGSMSLAFVVGMETAGDLQPVVNETRAGGSVVEGDMNGNGTVDKDDARIALELAQGMRSPKPSELAADPNHDFNITIDDVLAILKKIQE